jgi:hypothetical protein
MYDRIVLTAAQMYETIQALQQTGAYRREAVALWTGSVRGREGVVVNVVIPEQEAGPLHFNVPLAYRHRLPNCSPRNTRLC